MQSVYMLAYLFTQLNRLQFKKSVIILKYRYPSKQRLELVLVWILYLNVRSVVLSSFSVEFISQNSILNFLSNHFIITNMLFLSCHIFIALLITIIWYNRWAIISKLIVTFNHPFLQSGCTDYLWWSRIQQQ